MKATFIERLVIDDISPAVRIRTDDGKTYVFILEWQKLLVNGGQKVQRRAVVGMAE